MDYRTSTLQHGRAADPHVGRARPGRSRPAVRGQARGLRAARAIASLAFADLEIPLAGRPAHVGAQDRGARAAGAEARSAANRCSRSAPAAAISPRCSRAAPAASRPSRSTRGSRPSAARQARARRLRQRPLRGRRRRARLGHASTTTPSCSPGRRRCCPRAFFAAAEARRPRVRDRRRRAGDDGAPRALDGARVARHDRPFRDGGRAARERRGAGAVPVLIRADRAGRLAAGARTRRARRRSSSTCASRGNTSTAASRDRMLVPLRELAARGGGAAARSRPGPRVPSRQPQPAGGACGSRATASRQRAQPARRRRGVGARRRPGDAALLTSPTGLRTLHARYTIARRLRALTDLDCQ